METDQNDPKMAVWGQNHTFKENLENSSIKVQYMTPTDVFCPNFMPICPVTKKCEFTVPVAKTCAFSPPFYAPLAQGTKILTREI